MKSRKRFIVFVSAVIKNTKGEFLILKRSSTLSHHPSMWSIVSISVKSGETPEAAVRRGAFEEGGIIINPLRIFQTYNFFYENDKEQEAVGFVYDSNYISGGINLDLSKHSEFKWIKSSEIGNYEFTGTVKDNLLEIAGRISKTRDSGDIKNKLISDGTWETINKREQELLNILLLRKQPTDIQTITEKFKVKVRGEDPSYTLIYKTISTLKKKLEPAGFYILSLNGGYSLKRIS